MPRQPVKCHWRNRKTGWLKIFVVAFFAGLFCHTSMAAQLSAEGKAYSTDGQTLLYIEKHFVSSNSKKTVIYLEPNGIEFARKTLDYTLGSVTPLFQQQNSRLGEISEVKVADNNQLATSYKKNSKAKVKERKVKRTDALVIDAGFDNLVKQHWQTLEAGKTLTFDYLLPTRGRTVELSISRLACAPSKLCLQIFPTNSLLNLIVKNIQLEYARHSMQLLTFKGKSNIASHTGKYSETLIHYEHFPIQQKLVDTL